MSLVHGVELLLERDRIALHEHWGKGIFEPETVEVFRREVAGVADRCVIDVGGYTGLFTLIALQAGASEVVTIEPNPAGYERILANLKANGATPAQVTVIQKAAHSAAGSGHLYIDHERRGICSTGQLVPRDGRTPHVVELVRIDDVPRQRPVGVIKIDVEGHELEALMGASGTLAQDHPLLFIEVNSRSGGDRIEPITAFLDGFGYVGTPVDDRNMVFR